MYIEVTNTSQAEMILEFFGIESTSDNGTIIVNDTNYQEANKLLYYLKPKPPKPKKIRVEEKSKSGPKTKASQGERRHIKRNISLIPDNDDYVLSQQKEGELITHTINRIIEEHRQYNEKV